MNYALQKEHKQTKKGEHQMADIITQEQYDETVQKIRSYTKKEDLTYSYKMFREEAIKTSVLVTKMAEGTSEYEACSLLVQIFCMWAANAIDRLIDLGFYKSAGSAVRVGYQEAYQKFGANASASALITSIQKVILAAYENLEKDDDDDVEELDEAECESDDLTDDEADDKNNIPLVEDDPVRSSAPAKKKSKVKLVVCLLFVLIAAFVIVAQFFPEKLPAPIVELWEKFKDALTSLLEKVAGFIKSFKAKIRELPGTLLRGLRDLLF